MGRPDGRCRELAILLLRRLVPSLVRCSRGINLTGTRPRQKRPGTRDKFTKSGTLTSEISDVDVTNSEGDYCTVRGEGGRRSPRDLF